jgi:hypothetical protein
MTVFDFLFHKSPPTGVEPVQLSAASKVYLARSGPLPSDLRQYDPQICSALVSRFYVPLLLDHLVPAPPPSRDPKCPIISLILSLHAFL